jgi:hypothetical protein
MNPQEITAYLAAPHMAVVATVHPNHGDRYTIVRGDAGAFRVEPSRMNGNYDVLPLRRQGASGMCWPPSEDRPAGPDLSRRGRLPG